MPHVSPLRYPGGKAKLTDFVGRLLQCNSLEDGHYAEPYAGGASVALALLFGEYVSHIHINDIDPSIFAFWWSVKKHSDELCRLIRDTPITPREWRRQRAIHEMGRAASRLELGFAAFFLNRTNRSGIIGSGGMIGGVRQTGRWLLDARFNRVELVQRVERIAANADRISVYNEDAADFIAVLAGSLPTRALVYLDPPYYIKGQQRLYANYYKPEDHARILDLLEICPFSWIVSYDAAPEIVALYRLYRQRTYNLNYSASARNVGAEVIAFSHDLAIPEGSITLTSRGRRTAP